MSRYWRGRRVLVTGGSGFIGRHLVPMLRAAGATVIAPTRREIDLERTGAVVKLAAYAPDTVIHLAAYFGGMHFVNATSDIASRNTAINDAVIRAIEHCKPESVVVALSSCLYSPSASVPYKEEDALVGELHSTVAPFGETKRALLRWALERPAVSNLKAAIFTTVYGPGDNVRDPRRAHFLGGMLGRMEQARIAGDATFPIWGTGTPVRDVLYVTDAAEALMHIAEHSQEEARGNAVYNVTGGSGEHTIGWYAGRCAAVLDFKGRIVNDLDFQDGHLVKYVDGGRLKAAGWTPQVGVDRGLAETVAWMRRGTT